MTFKVPTLEEAEQEIQTITARLSVLKNFVNGVYIFNGQAAPYSVDGQPTIASPVVPKARYAPDEFIGKPFAFCARAILERKKAANPNEGPTSADEIYDALKAGGYGFDVNGVDAQKNGIKIALGKNSQTFIKIPNSDLFGLVEWYGGIRAKRATRKSSGTEPDDNEAEIETDKDTAAEAQDAAAA